MDDGRSSRRSKTYLFLLLIFSQICRLLEHHAYLFPALCVQNNIFSFAFSSYFINGWTPFGSDSLEHHHVCTQLDCHHSFLILIKTAPPFIVHHPRKTLYKVNNNSDVFGRYLMPIICICITPSYFNHPFNYLLSTKSCNQQPLGTM